MQMPILYEVVNELETAKAFFQEYKELDSLCKKHGFYREKDLILFDHEVITATGLRTYFRISEPVDMLNAKETDTINFYIGVHLGKESEEYEFDKISVILCHNMEIKGIIMPVPFASKQYFDWECPLPTKSEIYEDVTELFQIEKIKEKFNLSSSQYPHALSLKSNAKPRL